MTIEVFAKYTDWDSCDEEEGPVILKYINADSLKNLKFYLTNLYDVRFSIIESKGTIKGKDGVWTFTPNKEFYYDIEDLYSNSSVINLNGKFFKLSIE